MTVSQVVLSLVRRYAKQYPHTERDDLMQVACETALRAARTWRPGGAALTTYVWKAVDTMLYRWVAKAWAPVHGGDRRCRALLGTHSVSVDTCNPHGHGDDSESAAEAWPLPVPSDQLPPDVLVDRVRAYRRLHSVIAQQPEAAIAMEYLLGDRSAGEVADRLGCSVNDVRRIARATRNAIRADNELRVAARGL